MGRNAVLPCTWAFTVWKIQWGQLSIPVQDVWQDKKDWVRKYTTTTGFGFTLSLINLIYLKSIVWTCIPLPIPDWVSTTTPQSGSLFTLCPESCFSLLWRPPHPAEHPWSQLPQGMLPTSLSPVHSRAMGKLWHPKRKPQTSPPAQQPAHGVAQGPEDSKPALHSSVTATLPHGATEGSFSFTAWCWQEIVIKINTLSFSHAAHRMNWDLSVSRSAYQSLFQTPLNINSGINSLGGVGLWWVYYSTEHYKQQWFFCIIPFSCKMTYFTHFICGEQTDKKPLASNARYSKHPGTSDLAVSSFSRSCKKQEHI